MRNHLIPVCVGKVAKTQKKSLRPVNSIKSFLSHKIRFESAQSSAKKHDKLIAKVHSPGKFFFIILSLFAK